MSISSIGRRITADGVQGGVDDLVHRQHARHDPRDPVPVDMQWRGGAAMRQIGKGAGQVVDRADGGKGIVHPR